MAKPIPMKNTHHAEMTELVIGKDLAWMTGVKRVAEPKADFGITDKNGVANQGVDAS